MKEIRLRDMVTETKNSRTQQISFCLKARKLKKLGVTPEELLSITFVKPQIKFYKKD